MSTALDAPPRHAVGVTASIGDDGTPLAPQSLSEMGIHADVLANLALKYAYTVARLTTKSAAAKLCLPVHLAGELLERLHAEHLLEVLGHIGLFDYQFAITERGRQRAARLLEISGYVGPAPVSLEAYCTSLSRQFEHFTHCTPQQVADALREMVLLDDDVRVAGLALVSRRSLFLYGPPGNGKTCLGHLLHAASDGPLWIPHCLAIDENIIRIFDAQCHEPFGGTTDSIADLDQRWVRIHRPFVVVGGELTLDSLDLTYSRTLGFYEAPLHVKANGGMFLLDDFGCQADEPHKFLNRWIHPLERGVDYLTLQTGQQVQLPFSQMLIVSTNLDPSNVMSPAFLRRIGYRLHMDNPTPGRYGEIFQRYAAQYDLTVPPSLMQWLVGKYESEGRPLRCCEPRDLIERARDITRYSSQPLALTPDVLDLAWRGYFGN